jgi:hypothetical protein
MHHSPPPPLANSFVIGTAVISTHTYTYSSSTHTFPDERKPIEATPLSATSAELGLGLGLGFIQRSFYTCYFKIYILQEAHGGLLVGSRFYESFGHQIRHLSGQPGSHTKRHCMCDAKFGHIPLPPAMQCERARARERESARDRERAKVCACVCVCVCVCERERERESERARKRMRERDGERESTRARDLRSICVPFALKHDKCVIMIACVECTRV